MDHNFYWLVTLAAAGYVSGCWLGSVTVCRLAGKQDPRFSGSCNPGASNVLRLYGKRLALATLLVDAFKSWPVLAIGLVQGLSPWALGVVGISVLLGHCYPGWNHFRGGKAVASAFGVMLLLVPGVALVCALVWVLLVWRVRTASLASLVSATMAPLASLWLAPGYSGVVAVFALLVLARHAINIRRVAHGEEPRI